MNDKAITNPRSRLSFAQPNGIGPIKPPKATFVFDFPDAEKKEPIITMKTPIMIRAIPTGISFSILILSTYEQLLGVL